MRKWFRRIGLAAGLVLGIGAMYYFLRPADPISEKSFERIQVGMTEKEVEGILGAPATVNWGTFVMGSRGWEMKCWTGRGTEVQISFENGKVFQKDLLFFDSPSMWERFLEFLGFPPDSRRVPGGGKQKRVDLA